MKTNLIQNQSPLDLKASLFELKLLIFLHEHEHHPSIVRLLGARTSRIRKRQLFIALEYCEHGDLASYLRSNRDEIIARAANLPNALADRPYVTPNELLLANIVEMRFLQWILQVLDGLIFLGSKRVIHCDVAARNVLLDSSMNTKICDFGMSYQIASGVTDEQDVYSVSPNVMRPWWSTAPEAYLQCKYSVKSDVYSFGVLLWELFTLGGEPWAEFRCEKALELQKVLELQKAGECLPMPRVRAGNAARFELTLVTDEM